MKVVWFVFMVCVLQAVGDEPIHTGFRNGRRSSNASFTLSRYDFDEKAGLG